jgi:hypothetical protein
LYAAGLRNRQNSKKAAKAIEEKRFGNLGALIYAS